MKKIIIIIFSIIVVLFTVVVTINNKNDYKNIPGLAYKEMYEANTLITNIVYDIDITWSYYLTDKNFNRRDLTKKISLEPKDMTDESCSLIKNKKISVILDCITISHSTNFKEAKYKLNDASSYLKSIKNNPNYKDLKKLNTLLRKYLNITNYHGDDYDDYKKEITKLKKQIDKLEEKLNDIYPFRTSSSL